MPKYKNATDVQIYWRNDLWNPGDVKTLKNYVPHEDLGLTVIDASPEVPSPILVSEDVVIAAGTPEAIDIPYAPRIIISAVTLAGEGALVVGEQEIALDDKADYISTALRWDKVGSIELKSTAGATVRLLVEEVL